MIKPPPPVRHFADDISRMADPRLLLTCASKHPLPLRVCHPGESIERGRMRGLDGRLADPSSDNPLSTSDTS